jgi:hypothetical protein
VSGPETVTLNCDRCDTPMTRQPFYEGSKDECWYCPCCRSSLRTPEMLATSRLRRQAESGLSPEEYLSSLEERIARVKEQQITDAEMAQIEKSISRRAAEWKPACEHDTENPWL